MGVISDTHGLLRPEAISALQGSSLILHAGDVGDMEVVQELEKIAPVVAVRGNMDRGDWARELSDTQVVEVEGTFIYILHDVGALDLIPAAAGIKVVIFGHSHRPEIRSEGGVLFFNPGSAGHRRYTLPATVGRLTVREGLAEAEVLILDTAD